MSHILTVYFVLLVCTIDGLCVAVSFICSVVEGKVEYMFFFLFSSYVFGIC